MRKMWQELWWFMASGKMSEYERIKRLPVLEFWALYDLWKKQTDREREIMKARQKR